VADARRLPKRLVTEAAGSRQAERSAARQAAGTGEKGKRSRKKG